MKRVGLISDTHGSVHPQVFRVFEGVDLILHAGDVDSATLLSDLEVLAPVLAVRGNMDAAWMVGSLPPVRVVEVERHQVALVHNLHHLQAELSALGMKMGEIDVVVYGHTHVPEWHREGKILYVNPGSARASSSRASVALLQATSAGVDVRIVRFGEDT